ncbi:MAG: hypothetical protein ACR2PT_06045 [Endozoicomonas sp.]
MSDEEMLQKMAVDPPHWLFIEKISDKAQEKPLMFSGLSGERFERLAS